IEIGDKEVVVAIVVVVADGHAHAETWLIETDLGGDVGKRAVAIVAVQARGGQWSGGRSRVNGLDLDAEQVGPTVVVIVDPGNAGTHDLMNVVLGRGTVEVDEVDPCHLRHVLEAQGGRDGWWRSVGIIGSMPAPDHGGTDAGEGGDQETHEPGGSGHRS